jgi:hypothetical protein
MSDVFLTDSSIPSCVLKATLSLYCTSTKGDKNTFIDSSISSTSKTYHATLSTYGGHLLTEMFHELIFFLY